MSDIELVICGNALYNGSFQKVSLGISDGRIVSVKKILSAEHVVDYGDRLIMPGVVDPHVHFREPGQTYKEDFDTGTLSASFGGVTTILDMPNNIPPVTSAASFRDKFSTVHKKANVDFGLFSALLPMDRPDMEELLSSAVGFKLYMGPTTGNLYTDDESIQTALSDLAAACESTGLKARITAHCEDPWVITRRLDGREAMVQSLSDHDRIRDVGQEAMRTRQFLDWTAEYIRKGLFSVNIAHVSSPLTLNTVKRASSEMNMEVSTEVTPHHLFLNASYFHPDHRNPAFGKVNPPLRDIDTQRALWKAIASDMITMFGSDHAPHTIEEKSLPFHEAPAGLPGVETSLPLMLSLLKHQNMTLQGLLEMGCQHPADFFGLKGKGRIAEGADADIVVVDFRRTSIIKADKMHSKCGWTPYEGREGIFPMDVYLRGKRVIHDGELEESHLGREVVSGKGD